MEGAVSEHAGYEYVSTNNTDENLLCKVCSKPPLDPVVLSESGRLVCRAMCHHKDDPSQEPQKIILNLLDGLLVVCKCCKMELKRGCFQTHVEVCPLTCPYNCGQMITRATLSEHSNVCVKHVISCPASDLGCPFVRLKNDTTVHQCEFLSLAPVLRAQKAEIVSLSSLVSAFSHRYAQLCGVDWSGRDLSGYHLDGANLSRANLSKCDLSNAILAHADLNFTNLSGANLSGANLCGATLVRANLNGVCLTGVSLAKVDLAQLDADGSTLLSVVMGNPTHDKSVLRGADLSNSSVSGLYRHCIEIGTPSGTHGMILSGTDFSGFDLSGTNFANATMTECNFSGANLTGTILVPANLNQAVFRNAILANVQVTKRTQEAADIRELAAFHSVFR